MYNSIIELMTGSKRTKGNYIFPQTTGTIMVDEKDLESFTKLYNSNGGNQTIGFGEIALYWLFKGELYPCDHLDLEYKSNKIDVKSYNKTGYLTLGKWKDNINSRKLINSIFSCYNLLNIGNNGTFKSELNFGTSHIGDAIRSNIELHQSIKKMKTKNLSKVEETLDYVFSEFKKLSKNRGRKFIDYSNSNIEKIVDESIADLIYGLINYKLFESDTGIGLNGYIVNVVKDKNTPTGEIQIYRANGLRTESAHLLNNFSVVSGEIKIKTEILKLI
jgi:hypothetical protein